MKIALSYGHDSNAPLIEEIKEYHSKDAEGNLIPVVANNRVVCIDKLEFAADGTILPVKMTFEGVSARPLRPNR